MKYCKEIKRKQKNKRGRDLPAKPEIFGRGLGEKPTESSPTSPAVATRTVARALPRRPDLPSPPRDRG